MSVYAIVSPGGRVIEAPVNLISKYKDKTGFHLLSDEERKAYGWYPCEVINESFNSETQDRNPPEISFDGEKVTVEYTIIDKTPEAILAAKRLKMVVTPRQARIALALQPATDPAFDTLLAQVESAFGNLPEPDKTIASVTWEYSTEVQRSNQLIAQMQAIISYTDEQIDALFVQAAAL